MICVLGTPRRRAASRSLSRRSCAPCPFRALRGRSGGARVGRHRLHPGAAWCAGGGRGTASPSEGRRPGHRLLPSTGRPRTDIPPGLHPDACPTAAISHGFERSRQCTRHASGQGLRRSALSQLRHAAADRDCSGVGALAARDRPSASPPPPRFDGDLRPRWTRMQLRPLGPSVAGRRAMDALSPERLGLPRDEALARLLARAGRRGPRSCPSSQRSGHAYVTTDAARSCGLTSTARSASAANRLAIVPALASSLPLPIDPRRSPAQRLPSRHRGGRPSYVRRELVRALTSRAARTYRLPPAGDLRHALRPAGHHRHACG